MKTTKYKILRIFVQIIAILTFVVNMATFFVFLSCSLDKIEHFLVPKPTVMFSDFSLYITGLNIFFSLISLCSITSKSKLLMNMCSNLLYVQLCCSVLSTLYFQLLYKSNVVGPLANGLMKNNGGFIAVMRGINITPVDGSLVEGFRRYVDTLTFTFTASQIASTVFVYVMIKSFQYTLTIPLEKKVEIPEIKQTSKLGNIDLNLIQAQPISLKGF